MRNPQLLRRVTTTIAEGSPVDTPSSLVYATVRAHTKLPAAAKGHDAGTPPLRILTIPGIERASRRALSE